MYRPAFAYFTCALFASAAITACSVSGGHSSSVPGQTLPSPSPKASPSLSPSPSPSPAPGIFVANQAGTITSYALNANGNVTPLTTISGSNTGLVAPFAIARDTSGKTYVTDNNPSIRIFAAGATGNVAPVAVIAGPNTLFLSPIGIAIDSTGKIFVADFAGSGTCCIYVFAAGSSGNVAPITTISGSNTGLNGAEGLKLDNTGRIWVANQNAGNIEAFAAGASGNAAPVVTIAGTNTGMDSGTHQPSYLALDGAGNVYVSLHSANEILKFGAGANGNVAPIANISGSNTGLGSNLGITADTSGKLYVTNTSGTMDAPSVTIYAPGSNGNVTPIATISGSNTGLASPIDVSL